MGLHVRPVRTCFNAHTSTMIVLRVINENLKNAHLIDRSLRLTLVAGMEWPSLRLYKAVPAQQLAFLVTLFAIGRYVFSFNIKCMFKYAAFNGIMFDIFIGLIFLEPRCSMKAWWI